MEKERGKKWGGKMSASFEEFLEHYKVDTGYGMMPFIHVADLGIWAWKRIMEMSKEKDFFSGFTRWDKYYTGRYLDYFMLHKEIAEACLGKEEIEKRLKGLAKTEAKKGRENDCLESE